MDLETTIKDFDRRKVKASCLCGSYSGIPIKKKDRYGINIVPFFCTDCGHIYSRFRFDEKDMQEFYRTSYRKLYQRDVSRVNKDIMVSRSDYSRKVILPSFQKLFSDRQNRIVIEWGCSGGWNLLPFFEKQIQTFGFDFDRHYVEYGKKEFGLPLMVLTDEHVPIDFHDRADFLILNHILEHVIDPRHLLQKLCPLLKKEGYLFIGLPFIDNMGWENGFHNHFHIAHLHYFSFPFFRELIKKNGFQIVREDKRNAFIILQKETTQSTILQKRYRLYNGFLIIRYGLPDLFWDYPWRRFTAFIKKSPRLKIFLTKLRQRSVRSS